MFLQRSSLRHYRATGLFLLIISSSVIGYAEETPFCRFSGGVLRGGVLQRELYCRHPQTDYTANLGTLEENRNFAELKKHLLKNDESFPRNREALLKAKVTKLHFQVKGVTKIISLDKENINLEELWKKDPRELHELISQAQGGAFKSLMNGTAPDEIELIGPIFSEPFTVTTFNGDGGIHKMEILPSVKPGGVVCHYTDTYGGLAHRQENLDPCWIKSAFVVGEVQCIDYGLNAIFKSIVVCPEEFKDNATKCFTESKIPQTQDRTPLQEVVQ